MQGAIKACEVTVRVRFLITWLITVSLAILACAAYACPQFLTAPIYSTNGKNCALVAGDFNGDGKLDVAGPCRISNSVIVVLGRGDGTFDPPTEYPTVDAPFKAVVADFNLDGKQDLALLTYGQADLNSVGIVSILLGNGDGTFQPRTDYPVGLVPFYLATGDVNGDGAPDLAAANSNEDSVAVLLNQGNGTFVRQADVYTSHIGPLAIADLNGDGKGDLVEANWDQVGPPIVNVFLNNGDGTFRTPVSYSLPDYSNDLVVADLDRDGHLDIVSVGLSVTILYGKGDGTFTSRSVVGSGASRHLTKRSSDTNFGMPGDGVFRPSSESLKNLAPATTSDFTAILFPTIVAVGDFNYDGLLDYVVPGPNAVNVILGKTNRSFESAAGYGVGTEVGAVVSGDFNGDGRDDIVAADAFGFSVLLSNADGTFNTDRFLPSSDVPADLTIGDFNGDGKPDLAVANGNPFTQFGFAQNTVSVLLNNGNGAFNPHTEYATGAYPFGITAADFNGDGKADLAVANHDGRSVSILLANSDGTFRPHVDYPIGYYVFSVAAADLNGDGKIDLAVANGGGVSILLGNGHGAFQSSVTYETAAGALSVTIADFNGDGKLDFATANDDNLTVSVLLGAGDGTFGTHTDFPAGGPVLSVAAGDFNGDGKADLAAADGGETCTTSIFGEKHCTVTGIVGILLGNGDGTLRPVVTYETGAGAQRVAVGDMNGDGKQDLIVPTGGVIDVFGGTIVTGFTVSVLLGRGDGTFRPELDYSTASGPFAVAVGDFNGDHKDDMVIADANDTGVNVFLNASNGPAYILATTSCCSSGNSYTGDVYSSPGGITCGGGGPCNHAFAPGTPVSLFGRPDRNNTSVFLNWSGDCFGSGACALDMTADKTVAANFTPNTGTHTITVIKSGAGSGTVAGGALNCGDTCSNADLANSVDVLTAFPDAGAIFAGWSGGDCRAGEIDCVVTMDSDKTITAFFNPGPVVTLTVQITGTGTGSVLVYPPGPLPVITCTATCSVPFALGAVVQLVPEWDAASGFTFPGWGGACSTFQPCNPLMNSNKTVIATFNAPNPDFSLSGSDLSPAAVRAGQSATSTITVAAIYGFSSSVSLTCSVSPAPPLSPKCSINPNSIAPGAVATLTVTTTGAQVAFADRDSVSWLLPAVWLPLGSMFVFGIAFKRDRTTAKLLRGVCCSLLLMTLLLLPSCGGSSQHGSPGTPSGNYTITVKGTSGSMEHPITVSLTVQ